MIIYQFIFSLIFRGQCIDARKIPGCNLLIYMDIKKRIARYFGQFVSNQGILPEKIFVRFKARLYLSSDYIPFNSICGICKMHNSPGSIRA
jgi:hypothetical protein